MELWWILSNSMTEFIVLFYFENIYKLNCVKIEFEVNFWIKNYELFFNFLTKNGDQLVWNNYHTLWIFWLVVKNHWDCLT